MFAIIIQEKGGEQRRLVFDKPEVTIGRVQGNDIVLPKGNVSKRHARIVLKDGKFIIVDLKSTNGTYVNGRKITSPLVVKESDKIYIGDFIMGVDEGGALSEAGSSPDAAAPRFDAASPPPPEPVRPPRFEPPPPTPPHAGGASPELLRAALARQEPPRPSPLAPEPPAGRGDAAPAPPALRADEPPRPIPRPVPVPGGSPPLSGRGADGGAIGSPSPREMAPPAAGPDSRARVPRPVPGGTLPPPGASPSPGAGGATAPAPPSLAARAPASDGGSPWSPPAPVAAPSPASVQPAGAVAGAPASAAAVTAVGLPAERPSPGRRAAPVRRLAPRPVPSAPRRGLQLEPLDPKIIKLLDLQTQILERLRTKLDLDNIPVDRLGDEDLWQKAERAIVDLVETLESSGELPKYIDQDTLIKETLNEALGLGPLEDLLADDKVDEIIVDRRDRVVVGKDGLLRGSGKSFSSDEGLRKVVERLVAPTGLTIGEEQPLIDVRLRDGSRLTAAVPPVATQGACLVLRKPRTVSQTLADLVTAGALSAEMNELLTTSVVARRNLLVCGGVGSNKSDVVAALAAATPVGERVVTVEEVSEIALKRDGWVGLETRPSDGKVSGVDLAQLTHAALRLRPDRLVIGEVGGSEAFELASALGSWVDGAVIGVAADGAQAALNRIAVLARLATPESAEAVVREIVAGAFDLVVHVARFTDGTLRMVAIEEVLGLRDGGFETQAIFTWRGTEGGHAATGAVPRFYAELEARGIPADAAVFKV